MKIQYCVALAVLSAIPFIHGLAQEPANTYEPVNFPADQSSITDRIAFPKYAGDILVRVFCDVGVTSSGDFENSVCWSGHEEKVAFTQADEKNIDITQLSPARVDGSEVDVYFQYTVQFEKRGDVETIKLFPHQFVGVDGPGDDYIGPQRYRNSMATGTFLGRCDGSYLIWYGMIIPAEGGKPVDVRALNESRNVNCVRHTRQLAEGGIYIPAFLRGVPITAPYREAWADRAWR